MDTIIYVRWSLPGGMDGRSTEKGRPIKAFVDKAEAEAAKCHWSIIKPKVVDLEKVFQSCDSQTESSTAARSSTTLQRLGGLRKGGVNMCSR